MPPLTIDLDRNPELQFRIDNFRVPAAVREEFVAAMRRNLAFIETLPGFHGHLVFEKVGGASAFDVTTIAVWEGREAVDRAVADVRAYYARIGFDPQAFCARLGVTAELGTYHAPRGIQ